MCVVGGVVGGLRRSLLTAYHKVFFNVQALGRLP